MSYITLPKINNDINECLKINEKYDSSNNIYISVSLYNSLNRVKQRINNHLFEWDTYKKCTNPYEYIHSIEPEKNLSVCKYKPLSRSYYKMIEIIHTFELLKDTNDITSFHLAEGPGGFIEAFCNTRNNINDTYYGITLLSNNDNNIPSWKKSTNYLNNHKNINIEYGVTKNGNLFDKKNLEYFFRKYHLKIDYITADGGFDFSNDFNNQEFVSTKLIITQIIYAIVIQKPRGHFILKIFDIFTKSTVNILYLLSNLYQNVYIYKPCTSRIANSEKYIICKNFNNIDINLVHKFIDNFDYIINNITDIDLFKNTIIPKYYINKLEETNAIYGQQQIENISLTLNIINNLNDINSANYNKTFLDNDKTNNKNNRINNKINILKNNNIHKCITWCNKHKLPINNCFKQFYYDNDNTDKYIDQTNNQTIDDECNNESLYESLDDSINESIHEIFDETIY